ncbi:GRB2-associated-binding protein 3 [Chanos chanos]|uniref:GRB2-associated-binding protein 3 n=1 Tax=Chanos chanos TaxID=29144 RepID=A0A6J2WXA2_CHACN|nr:GRB2-associated-binding protein 3 [Chanos chanos]
MSTGDVVLTGWLIKSPPERKLKRYSWRKRWFVLRRGRMSGDPDVLEYYRSKSSRKPIRTIDLQECEVHMQAEVRPSKRLLQNQHLFVIKTTTRIFYLLAKTQEEMNSWVQNIGQICTFGSLEDGRDTPDSASHPPSSQQPSPVLSPHVTLVANQDIISGTRGVTDVPSESETSPPLDYLFLSQCETGRRSIIRCDSFSTSERSLEQSSSENASEDIFCSPPRTDPSPFIFGGGADPPLSAQFGPASLSSLSSVFSSPCSVRPPPDVFRFDRPFCATPDSLTPPPLPPKPTHLSDHHGDEGGRPALLPRRVSLSGLEHFRRGEYEFGTARHWNKRLSLNLPAFAGGASPQIQCEDSYVPMSSPPVSCSEEPPDGYIPMSPTSLPLCSLTACGKAEPPPSPPTPDVEPPPVNRSLKPRRRARPPPLDLSGLSTIKEHPTHLPVIRTLTEPTSSPLRVPLDRRRGPGINSAEPETSLTSTQTFSHWESASWFRPSHLDYLSLDFNSSTPSPVQKKPLLADEHRVDYVQVDEKKTQALASTKMEWKDVRQSKV